MGDQLLGSAEVVADQPGRLVVRLEDGRERRVQPAFAFPYQPALGDLLLVIGDTDALHAVGVIRGQATSVLAFAGDAEVRAEGTLHLRGGQGVELEAPQVTLRAELLRAFAGTLVERAGTAYRWIEDQLTVRAGESRRLTQGDDVSQSKRSVTLAEGTVKVDGKQVQLGH